MHHPETVTTMVETPEMQGLLTLAEAEQEFGVKRATLYRYAQQGKLHTYRRGMDRRVYVRRADLEDLRRFRPPPPAEPGQFKAALERAREFQRRVFGDRVLTTTSAEIIEEARRERDEELP
jgi:hypothetical protein